MLLRHNFPSPAGVAPKFAEADQLCFRQHGYVLIKLPDWLPVAPSDFHTSVAEAAKSAPYLFTTLADDDDPAIANSPSYRRQLEMHMIKTASHRKYIDNMIAMLATHPLFEGGREGVSREFLAEWLRELTLIKPASFYTGYNLMVAKILAYLAEFAPENPSSQDFHLDVAPNFSLPPSIAAIVNLERKSFTIHFVRGAVRGLGWSSSPGRTHVTVGPMEALFFRFVFLNEGRLTWTLTPLPLQG
jgi:hypothetical protein